VFNGRRILPTTAAIRKVHSGNSKSWSSGDGTGSGFADDDQLPLDVVDVVPLSVQRWYSAPGSTDWWRSGPSSTGDSSLLAPQDRTGPDRWYSALSSTRPPNKWAHNNNSFYRYTIPKLRLQHRWLQPEKKQINGQAAKPSLLPDTHYTWLMQPIGEPGTYTIPKYIYYPID